MRGALHQAATDLGREVAAADSPEDPARLTDLLLARGYEPYDDGGVTRLRNCPFHRLAREHTDLVCGMNLALTGVVQALGGDVRPRLDPAPDRCCVAFDR